MTKKNQPSQIRLYLRLIKYLSPLKWHFLLSFLGFLVFAATQPMLAKYFEWVIDAIDKHGEIEHWGFPAQWALPVAAILIYVVRGIGSFFGNYYNEYVGITVVTTLKQELFRKLLYLPAAYYDKHNHGVLLHKINNAATMVQRTVTDALKILVREGLTVLFLLAYAFYLNWQLSVIFILLAPLMAFLVRYTSKRFRKISKQNEANLGDQMQVAKEAISNYQVVRGFGAQLYEYGRYFKSLQKSYFNQLKIRKIGASATPVSQLIVAFALAVIVYFILSPQMRAQYSTAELIGYLTAIALLPKAFKQLGGLNAIIQRGLVGAEIVFEIIDQAVEPDQGKYIAENVRGDIQIQALSFTYPGKDEEVLKQITCSIKAGETIALVGESGSGKSTLAKLLARQYSVPSGSIFIDGTDINDYQLDNLRGFISVVSQNAFLFNDTIYNNIVYGERVVSEQELADAIEHSYAGGFIERQSQGLQTVIGDDGQALSGGQRQRLSIARAFIKKAPILILDEATSALDNESESVIKQAVEELAENKTTIIIAHRLSTIEHADRVLVMKNGELVEEGSHADLVARGGYYAGLYQTEFS